MRVVVVGPRALRTDQTNEQNGRRAVIGFCPYWALLWMDFRSPTENSLQVCVCVSLLQEFMQGFLCRRNFAILDF